MKPSHLLRVLIDLGHSGLFIVQICRGPRSVGTSDLSCMVAEKVRSISCAAPQLVHSGSGSVVALQACREARMTLGHQRLEQEQPTYLMGQQDILLP